MGQLFIAFHYPVTAPVNTKAEEINNCKQTSISTFQWKYLSQIALQQQMKHFLTENIELIFKISSSDIEINKIFLENLSSLLPSWLLITCKFFSVLSKGWRLSFIY